MPHNINNNVGKFSTQPCQYIMYYSRKTHYAIIDADVPNVLVYIFTKDFGLNIGLVTVIGLSSFSWWL